MNSSIRSAGTTSASSSRVMDTMCQRISVPCMSKVMYFGSKSSISVLPFVVPPRRPRLSRREFEFRGRRSGQYFLQERLGALLLGRGQDLSGVAAFDDQAFVHEQQGVGDLAGEADFVGDHDHGHALGG